MLDKMQIQEIFLFEYKMACKEAETAHNIHNTFGPETANECTVQWWLKEFCRRDRNLDDEEHSGQPSEVDDDQMRSITEADPLTTKQEVSQELNIHHSMVVWPLKQIRQVKKLNKWMPHELTKNCKKKNLHFEVSSSHTLWNNNKPFLNWIVTCNEKWIL